MFKLKRLFGDESLILESVLKADSMFKKIVADVYNRYNDPTALEIHRLFDKNVPTNINFLSVGKANDEITFVNDTQVSRMVDGGKDPFTNSRNNSKIGRAVRQLLAANGKEVSDKEIERFVNSYKIIWDELNKPLNIEIVSGEKIREWYHESKYHGGGGQLNGSCMRYPACQRFLDIYTKNPEQCQLVILKSDDGKLLGRALLWKCSDDSTSNRREKVDLYLDRVYTVLDHDREKIKNHVISLFPGKKILTHLAQDDITNIKVALEFADFERYPYMDSLYFVYPRKKYISVIKNNTDLVFQCRATDGSKTVHNWIHSTRMNQYYQAGECVMVNSLNSYMPTSECVRDYAGNWVYREDAVQSELYGTINRATAQQTARWGLVPRNELVEVKTGARTNIRMPKILENREFFKVRDKYNSLKYVVADYSFSDIFNKRYLTSEKRHFISYRTSAQNCLLKMYKINEEDVVLMPAMANPVVSYNIPGASYKLYSLPESTVPVAIEYNVPELISGTISVAPAKTTGIVATDFDINAFRLRKKRATRGTTNPEILIPFITFAYDAFLRSPITDVSREFIRAKANELGNADTTNAKMEMTNNINNFLYSTSADYQRNLKHAVLKDVTEESLFKEINKNLASVWTSRDVYIKNHMTDLPRSISTQRGIPENMLNHFNGVHPFNFRKVVNEKEFMSILRSRREQMVCALYLWSLTRDRVRSAKSAARHYGNKSQNSRHYLETWTNPQFSGNMGTSITNSCSGFSQNHKYPQNDPIGVMKCEEGYRKLLQVGEHEMFHNGLKAWELFKRDHFSTLFPPFPEERQITSDESPEDFI